MEGYARDCTNYRAAAAAAAANTSHLVYMSLYWSAVVANILESSSSESSLGSSITSGKEFQHRSCCSILNSIQISMLQVIHFKFLTLECDITLTGKDGLYSTLSATAVFHRV